MSFLRNVEEIKNRISDSGYNTLVSIYNNSVDKQKKLDAFNKLEFDAFVENLNIECKSDFAKSGYNLTISYVSLSVYTVLTIISSFVTNDFGKALESYFGNLLAVVLGGFFVSLFVKKSEKTITTITISTYLLFAISFGLLILIFNNLK